MNIENNIYTIRKSVKDYWMDNKIYNTKFVLIEVVVEKWFQLFIRIGDLYFSRMLEEHKVGAYHP
jgi:hypothetical protein